jgi:hypothetical protein
MTSVGAMPIKCHEPTVMALARSDMIGTQDEADSFLNLVRSHDFAERGRALSGRLAAGAYVDTARSLMQGKYLRAVPNKLHVGYGTSA